MNKIRLLIIDDSALIRSLLTEIFNRTPDIEVVGSASDPYIAREKIKTLNPDVLTLDIEMPRMDGLTFLRNLMRLRPMPVVMISTLTERGAEVTLEALKIGAIDFVPKPKLDTANLLQEYADEIVDKVRAAAQAKPYLIPGSTTAKSTIDTQRPRNANGNYRLIALGASTGGTEAIKQVAIGLPASMPPIVISQHLPVAFSESFARHVDEVSAMHVSIANQGQPLEQGNIYIAPGDRHLTLRSEGYRMFCLLEDSEPVNRHKPSVEVMFRSVAKTVGQHAIGVMLTGMGADGAQGMLEMRQAGAYNIVQDQASSVVWGMPGEAYKIGAADCVLPLDDIAGHLSALFRKEKN